MSFINKSIFCSLIVLLVSIIIYYTRIINKVSPKSEFKSKILTECLEKNQQIFYPEDLSKHVELPSILLGFLGNVYNVTNGQYYHPGGSYSVLSGRDATRVFVTGEFNNADHLIDDITDLNPDSYADLESWKSLFDTKYPKLGVVVGTYYDAQGCPTKQLDLIRMNLKILEKKKSEANIELQRYPPCNSQYDGNTKKGRVWCTELSGGISRNWIGRPRQFYDLNQKQWRCACVQEMDKDLLSLIHI